MKLFLIGKTVYSSDTDGNPLNVDIPIPEIPPTDYGAALIKMVLSLVVLIVLLSVTFWALRRLIRSRLTKTRSTDNIHIIEKKMISPKSMLYLVEVDGERVLLAESQIEIRRIHHLSLHPPATDKE